MNIVINGITTHNLKNISTIIEHNKVTAISGVSGGGKSSLGFHTIHKLCRNEFDIIDLGFGKKPNYKIKYYDGLIPSISISQENRNNNPLSTIYTFLNVYNLIINNEGVDITHQDKIIINSYKNICKKCGNLGTVKKTNLHNLFHLDKPILNSIKVKSDKYQNTLIQFCKDKSIDLDMKFNQLDEDTIQHFLYGKHRLSEKVTYQSSGRKRQTLFFIGIVDEIKESKFKIEKYLDNDICSECIGSRVNKETRDINIFGIKFHEFITLPFSELIKLVDNHFFKQVLKLIIDLGCGYLSFNRSIPSLSGGELQKLKLTRVSYSSISGVLFIIDEISANLHESDVNKIAFVLEKIKQRGNTIIIIDHHDKLISLADKVYTLGPVAGNKGGYLVNREQYVQKFNKQQPCFKHSLEFYNLNKNNIKNQTIKLMKNAINVLTGVSGSGKSSLALAIKEKEKKSIYIKQKMPFSTYKTTVSSYLGIDNDILSIFRKSGEIKYCSKCNGVGILKIKRNFNDDLEVDCQKCNATGFTNSSLKKKINNHNIYEFMNMELSDIHDYISVNKKMDNIIALCNSLMISHITFSRTLRTLSGGEIQRIKIVKELISNKRTKDKILIIDEIGAGLDDVTSGIVIEFLNKIKNNFLSVLLIEHKPSIYALSDCIIVIGPEAGDNGGKVMDYKSPFDYHKNYILD
ncbi:ATP-binding cassette domain-containing protein [Photobacterium damselae subsp. damselae]